MGKLSLAAKITHVPSMYLSELPGRHHGCREAAIRGHQLIGERCRALGVDTIVVSDVHWLVNAGYHVNCNAQFSGTYTSNELPHFIRDMQYAYPGNPALGRLIAETATERGIATRAHEIDSLELEYGTLVPMRYERRPALQGRVDRRLVHVASARRKPALRRGAARSDREERLERRVSRERVAVAPLQRQRQPRGIDPRDQPRILPAGRPARGRAVEAGDFKTFCAMLPEYNTHCHGEGGMHDTAMLLGLLGWDRYDKPVEIVTDYFASSGTGQINAIFPLA